MAICAGCKAEVPDDDPVVGRRPCPDPACASMGRGFENLLVEVVKIGTHLGGESRRGGLTVGYGESLRAGTASSGDLVNGGIVHSIHGASPQGEFDTLDTAKRLVRWLNNGRTSWSEPTNSDAPHVDAVAVGVGANTNTVLNIQVVRAITDAGVWHQLGISGSYTASLTLDQAAGLLWNSVEKKAQKIGMAPRRDIVLLLDANRCPGQALPAVVDEYRRVFGDATRQLAFRRVYIAGPFDGSVFALDE